eukprot:GHUV01046766.1.p1 GENE.GHUV01046766.1~~GHUV01046766.1.p1  ORF type:complete len:108 (+),score=19.26 GHUV01046766.1:53-376(+)
MTTCLICCDMSQHLRPTATVLPCSNRSAAHLKAGDAEKALLDVQQCTKLRPNWEKGHFRQGAALEELGELEQVICCLHYHVSQSSVADHPLRPATHRRLGKDLPPTS